MGVHDQVDRNPGSGRHTAGPRNQPWAFLINVIYWSRLFIRELNPVFQILLPFLLRVSWSPLDYLLSNRISGFTTFLISVWYTYAFDLYTL
jgi:hypothetical protein